MKPDNSNKTFLHKRYKNVENVDGDNDVTIYAIIRLEAN
jgi:hypothetical protein